MGPDRSLGGEPEKAAVPCRHATTGVFAEHAANPTMSLNTWLASREVTEAQDIIVRASGASLASPFWQPVQTHIADNPLLNPNESSIRPYPDVGAPSLRAAVGEAEGLLCLLTDRVDAVLLAAAPRLRGVSSYSVGVDHVDLAAARLIKAP